MPIEHTVAFRLSAAPGSPEEAGFLDEARTALTSIPGVEDFAVMRQVSPKSPLAWQFRMRFADQAAYDAYSAHPTHVDFVERRWTRDVAEFQELDFVAPAA
ncbi:Dabb family protein [Georgenia faecalis]|uniref:Dabb family protein n=1 Tax=Georgenia faecalis TaxID=2483799 RepID=A0ABV9D9L7_9MICO|nr:Dabb family protein [Georgenia faecalis]